MVKAADSSGCDKHPDGSARFSTVVLFMFGCFACDLILPIFCNFLPDWENSGSLKETCGSCKVKRETMNLNLVYGD